MDTGRDNINMGLFRGLSRMHGRKKGSSRCCGRIGIDVSSVAKKDVTTTGGTDAWHAKECGCKYPKTPAAIQQQAATSKKRMVWEKGLTVKPCSRTTAYEWEDTEHERVGRSKARSPKAEDTQKTVVR